ncbi:MAG: hypothetical protein MAG795_00409 [Candidatus Woesearchaeota archaeon]|nr:hypothetical protein [Candidatus Woesearchaeota archaeon]
MTFLLFMTGPDVVFPQEKQSRILNHISHSDTLRIRDSSVKIYFFKVIKNSKYYILDLISILKVKEVIIMPKPYVPDEPIRFRSSNGRVPEVTEQPDIESEYLQIMGRIADQHNKNIAAVIRMYSSDVYLCGEDTVVFTQRAHNYLTGNSQMTIDDVCQEPVGKLVRSDNSLSMERIEGKEPIVIINYDGQDNLNRDTDAKRVDAISYADLPVELQREYENRVGEGYRDTFEDILKATLRS